MRGLSRSYCPHHQFCVLAKLFTGIPSTQERSKNELVFFIPFFDGSDTCTPLHNVFRFWLQTSAVSCGTIPEWSCFALFFRKPTLSTSSILPLSSQSAWLCSTNVPICAFSLETKFLYDFVIFRSSGWCSNILF